MRRIALLAALPVLMAGCISGHTERVADVDPYGWSPADTVWVESQNSDTISLRTLSLIVRFNKDMKEGTLDLAIVTQTPDSIRFAENISLNIAASAVFNNDHFESLIPYRTSSRLGSMGVYRFGFAPLEKYTGVTAIGIKTD